MALSTYLAGLFVIACFLISNSAAFQRSATDELHHSTTSPKWRTNLLTTIEERPLGLIYGQNGGEYKAQPKTSLWFIDNNELVATFIVRRSNSGVVNRGGADNNSADRLRLVFMDPNDGKVINVQDAPATSRNAGIIAVHHGLFVVQAGDELTLYSSNFRRLNNLILPTLENGEWRAYPSPTGDNVLFVPPSHRTGQWLWVNTDTLKITHSWQDTETGTLSISDDKVAMVTCTWRYDCPRATSVRGLDTEWRELLPGGRPSYPQFVDGNTIFVYGSPSTLIRTDGLVIFVDNGTLRECEALDKVYPAPTSHRFVAPSCRLKGSIQPFDMGGQLELREILIHDDSSKGWSYSLALKGSRIKGLSQFAVSPDGQRFAVLNNGWVQVFELPSPAH